MKSKTKMIGACLVSLFIGAAAWAVEYTGFTAVEVNGRCSAILADGTSAPVEVDKTYAFGTTVKTDRRSTVKLQFDPDNVFLVQARTRVVISENVDNPKLKVLQLERGQVNLSLDKFPKDHKLQVETPTAVCGAVGTRFVVSFESDEKDENATDRLAGSRETGFTCDKGEVFVASRFSVDGESGIGDSLNIDSVKAGSSLVATIHEGLENTYMDLTVNRGALLVGFGGKKGNEFSVEPLDENRPTRFQVALEKSDKSVNTTAVQVENGEVTSTRFTAGVLWTGLGKKKVEESLTPSDGAVVVKKKHVYKEVADKGGDKTLEPPVAVEGEAADASQATTGTVVNNERVASAYLEAAREEGELHSEWVDVTAEGKADPVLEAKVKTAAEKASKLRKQLQTVRTIRNLRLLKSGIRRSAPRPRHP